MRTYRDIFAIGEFRVLFGARLLTILAVSLGSLALGTVVYDATASTLLTAAAMFGGPLVTLLGTATIASVSDSIGPRRALATMPLVYALVFALQAMPSLPWPARLVLMAVPFLAGAATSGSVNRMLTAVVPPDGFVLGRATLNVAVGLMQVLAFGVGGLLLRALPAPALFVGAALAAAATAVLVRFGLPEFPSRPRTDSVVSRTHAVNRDILSSRTIRPVLLAMWVPNGLIVGCEALFVPYGSSLGLAGLAGALFAVTAAGMLVGDVLLGRIVPPTSRDRLIEPLRLALAAPYLIFLFHPPLWLGLSMAALASVGYSAALPLQQRLVHLAPDGVQGQVFALQSNGMMVGQAVGALVAGAIATWLSPGTAMGVLAVASLLVTAALMPGLGRSTGSGSL